MTAPANVTASSTVVAYEKTDDVAVLRIANPPVNASTAAVREGIISGITRASEAADITAVVVIGSDRAFVSGSDLTEFDSDQLPEPQLPAVIAAIERCPKPVVAALTGATLGGGLELALGCDARIAAPTSVVGLPEVTLGMIPGAGGTQRLPRLIGAAATVQLVSSGRRVTAAQALELGIIDALCAEGTDLLATAVAFARHRAEKRILAHQQVRPDVAGAIEQAATAAISRYGARPQVVAAVGAVMCAVAAPIRDALALERNEFHRLRLGGEARALRHLFFAERAAGRDYRGGDASALAVAGVVGAGTMGTGITRACLDAGLKVVLVETNSEATDSAVLRLREGYRREVTRGRLDETAAQERLDRITTTANYSDLAPCDVVVEAVFEDPSVKTTVLREIERTVRPGIPIASNTSYLDLDELAATTSDPTRIVGLHFFSPAHATKIIEVVHAAQTARATAATAVALAKRLRKTPVVARVGFGFIGNRIFSAYRQQCELMLEEGALPHQIDNALESFGFAMGPFRVADLSGLDIAWRMRANTASRRDPALRYVDIADKLCEMGRFGQKAHAGWYRYEKGSTQPHDDNIVTELIEAESQRKGIERHRFADDEIVRRALTAMVNEATLTLAAGVAARPSDIDLMMTLGYGFPRYRGGPVFWALQQDGDVLEAEREHIRRLTGDGYRIGDLRYLHENPEHDQQEVAN